MASSSSEFNGVAGLVETGLELYFLYGGWALAWSRWESDVVFIEQFPRGVCAISSESHPWDLILEIFNKLTPPPCL
jgi:hypothetical protein